MGAQTLLKPGLYGPPAGEDAAVLRGGKCACGAVFFPMQSYGCEVCGRHGEALRPRDLVFDREAFAFGKLETIEDTDAYLLAKFARDDTVLI